MKRLLLLFFLFPLVAFTQKLKLNEYDKFIRQQRLESFPVKLKTATGMELEMALNSVGSNYFLHIMGTGSGANAINSDDEIVLLLDNGSTITIKNPYALSPGEDKPEDAYKLEYDLSYLDLEKLSLFNLQGLRRKNATTTIPVEKQFADEMKALGTVFIGEVKRTGAPIAKVKTAAPGFPGGNTVMQNFLNRNLKLQAAFQSGEMKTAVVEFVVKADGSVNDLQIKQSAGDAFDSELMRILKRMPKWKPAVENGKQIDAVVTKPVTFYRSDAELRVQL